MENWLTESAPMADPNYAAYKVVCKRDLKALGIDVNGWETLASERSPWRQACAARSLRVWKDIYRTGWDKETNEEGPKSRTQASNWSNLLTVSVEGTVILELVFPDTQGAVREPLIRARHHILWRQKDTNEKHVQSITKLKKLFLYNFS